MRYHQYAKQGYSTSASGSSESSVTRKRVQQLQEEIKIENPSDENYYGDKLMRKMHRRRRHG